MLGALAMLAPDAMLYLYKASAVPDQVWVMRRFLVSAFPLIVLLALGLASGVAGTHKNPRFNTAWRIAAVAFAIAAVAYPIYTIRNVRSMSEQRGYLQVIDDVCAQVGPHAAVIVLERDKTDLYDDWVPQALRSWCWRGSRRDPRPGPYRFARRRSRQSGRRRAGRCSSSPRTPTSFSSASRTRPHPTRQAVNTKFLGTDADASPEQVRTAVVRTRHGAGPDRITLATLRHARGSFDGNHSFASYVVRRRPRRNARVVCDHGPRWESRCSDSPATTRP